MCFDVGISLMLKRFWTVLRTITPFLDASINNHNNNREQRSIMSSTGFGFKKGGAAYTMNCKTKLVLGLSPR
jgi:hypothetical protein